jgi:two-component system NtrC family sensor kinase
MKETYSLIIGEVSDKGQLDILENLRLHHPETWVGVCFNKAPKELVRRGLNSSQIRFFIEDQNESLFESLKAPLRQRDLHLRRNWLLREYYQRNKNLESLTTDLEKIVFERTLHLEQSNKDQSDRIQTERTLIRFIKEIASQSAVEDVLKFLRKELRKFHKVGDLVLCLQFGGNNEVFYFRNGNVQKSILEGPFKMMDTHEISSAAGSKEMANILGRPFARAALYPLALNLLTQFHGNSAKALLCFEHSSNSNESQDFEEFISERLNPISMSLDRILLEHELDVFSYRWEKTFDAIRDPLAIIDMDYQLLRSNKKFIMGAKSHVCHKSFANLDEICPGCPLEKAVKAGTPQAGEVRVNQRIYQVWSYPIRLHPHEKSTSFVNQYVDITESRELYVKMLQHEKMGAIGALAGHIAHELNNPLTGIRSLAQVLMSEEAGTEVKKDLEEIEKAAKRCQRIIKNLLEFTQEDENQKELVSLDEVVERTLPMLKTALRNHRLNINLNTPKQKIEVFPHLLQQVVFNLVNNACQAMNKSGEIKINTSLSKESAADFVTLAIADTGPGVPLEIQDRIFEPFFTTKAVGQGTGLGLSISRKIVDRCGGEISFKSVLGEGTTFFLKFPLTGAGL